MKRPKCIQLLSVIIIALLIAGCGSSGTETDSTEEWAVPEFQVVQGGPGKDGIPSVDDPQFIPVDQTDYVGDDRLVLGIKTGEEVRAYPHQMMDWHEIVNDRFGDTALAITYCPLTGTGIAWNRSIAGGSTEFGVSGLIFRNNLVPYDRSSNSLWSQMQVRSINGPNIRTKLETVDLVETTWSTWKEMYPDSKVLSTESGIYTDDQYGGYLYGIDYLHGDSEPVFSQINEDERFVNKKRFHGVIASSTVNDEAEVKVYPISAFGNDVRVITDSFNGIDYVVAGSSNFDIAVSFDRTLPDGTVLNLEPVQNSLPVIMEDQEGNRWNIFGEAVSGPRAGAQLTPTDSYTGYWFAWTDFFPDLVVYQEN